MNFDVGFWRRRAVKAALDRGDDRRNTWGGHRCIKFPGDCMAMQMLLARCRPQVLVEIGTQYGGSTLFFATLAPIAGIEAIVSLDIADLPGRPQIPIATYLTGDSVEPATVAKVKALVGNRTCSVVVDGNHHAEQVDRELELYAPMVTPGQALIMEDTLVDVLRFKKFREHGGPLRSIGKYMPHHPEFELAADVEPYVTTNFFGYWVKKA
jgi:cephalosporin hydroxylase